MVIELGHDPKDIKDTEELIKKKNDDIATLKKELNIPHLQHPQTQEVLESKTRHEELMHLVLKLNDQLREIENELNNLIQLKQTYIGTSSVNVIPTATIFVPSTLAASLAPTMPMATTQPVSTKSTLVVGTLGEEVERLVKAMEEMSIQTIEMNKLKEKVTILETDYKLAKIMHKEDE